MTQLTAAYEVWNIPTTAGVTLTGGSATGANYGVFLNNYDGYNSPAQAAANNLTIVGMKISGASIAGVVVKDNPVDGGITPVTATITGNTSIGSSTAGVLVLGAQASATVINNSASITGNTVGVDVNAGQALIQNNNLTGNTEAGIRVENGATVDAGACSVANYTTLGTSTGGNILTGYGFDDAAPWAIENLNASTDPAVYAQNNSFGSGGPGDDIRLVLYDAKDNVLKSVVHASEFHCGDYLPAVAGFGSMCCRSPDCGN